MRKNICLIFILFTALFQPGKIFAQEYVVGGDFNYPPFLFIDSVGNPSGLDIEVLEAISVSRDLKFSYQLSSWDSALSYIQSGEIDILAGITYSEEREKFLDFTIPIHAEYYAIFIRKDLSFKDLTSLYDYRPVVLDKDISIDRFLIPMGLFKNYVFATSLPEALSAIETGLADYVVAPNIPGRNAMTKNNYEHIEIKGPRIIPSMYCLAVRKGDTLLLNQLNDGILELRKNGQLAEINEKWKVYYRDDHRHSIFDKYARTIFITAIVLFILVFSWTLLLLIRVKKATESINLKNQELQKSEKKFRIITENSSDIIWHLDSNFILTYISSADERIRGFKKEDVLGKSLFSVLKPEGIELLKKSNEKRLADLSKGIKAAPVIYELEELCKDGSWVWIEATATAIYDQDGNISGYHGVSRDISERKKAELLLKERESQLRELNSTKDKLFSIIAHDLRSPFNAILGFSEILIENIKDFEVAKSIKYLEIINSSAKNTLILLDNLLTWANAQTGKNRYKPEITNLPVIIHEILEESKSMANIKSISLNNTLTDDIEVYADVNMLKTILRNLTSNAIKYTGSNGEVSISAVQNQNNIEITVADNGVGMGEEIRIKVFEMNSNITTVGTAKEKGSGLGLILCKEFVEMHGGEIWVESELGKGSSFIFSLPVRSD